MLQRSLTALVAIPILVGAVWLGAPWLTALVLVAGLAGMLVVWGAFELRRRTRSAAADATSKGPGFAGLRERPVAVALLLTALPTLAG